MKSSYLKLEDIPAGDRQHYQPDDAGVYVLKVEDDHPTVVKLKGENTTLKGTNTRLTNENEGLKQNQLPPGHKPVPEATATALEEYQQLGTVKELKDVKAEHVDLKTKTGEHEREKHLASVAEIMGWDAKALGKVQGLPELVVRDVTENGKVVTDAAGQPKKTVIARVKGEGDAVTEKSFREVFDQTADLKLYEPMLLVGKQPPGVATFPAQLPTGGGGQTNLAASLIGNRYGHNVPQPPQQQQQK